MKIAKSVIVLVILLNGMSKSTAQNQSQSLSPLVFKSKAEKTKGVILDVRNVDEYNFAHIENAINIAVESEDFLKQIDSLDRNKPYFVYCSIGKRSSTAISIMQKEGFLKLYSLKGGFLEWKKEQLPIIKAHKTVSNH